MTIRRRSLIASTILPLSLGLTLGLPASLARAQSNSGRPLRIIIALPAGTSIDNGARLIAPYLSASLGQPVVIENKPGANGVIGMQELIKAAPDGNTLLLGSLSPL